MMGRRARFPDREFTYKALNRVIQGSAADEMKLKLVELHRNRKETGFKLRFTVHDEVNGDVPDKAAKDRVQAILNERLLPTRVPLLWSVATGANWLEAK
jgi:DNA polymerase-1